MPDPDTGARGDILILGTFTQGGAASNVRVFEWVGTGGNAHSRPAQWRDRTATFADCVPGNGGDNGCGTVNSASDPGAWGSGEGRTVAGGFRSRAAGSSRVASTYRPSGSRDASRAFVAETRSSPSVDAQLKDFALGDFEACGSKLTTTPSDSGGTALTDGDDEGTVPDVSIGGGSVDVTDSRRPRRQGNVLVGRHPVVLPVRPQRDDLRRERHARSHREQWMRRRHSRSFLAWRPSRQWGRTAGQVSSSRTRKACPDASDTSAGECFEVLPVTPEDHDRRHR